MKIINKSQPINCCVWALIALFYLGGFNVAAAADTVPLFSAVEAKLATPESSVAGSSKSANKEKNGAIRARSATINIRSLKSENRNKLKKRFNLNLFEDVGFVVVRDRVERNASGSVTWIGHIEGKEHSTVVMVIRDDNVYASISTIEATYEIGHTANGVHIIKQVDTSVLNEGDDIIIPSTDVEPDPPASSSSTSNDEGDDIVANDHMGDSIDVDADDGTIMDVLVVYSNEARDAALGVINIESAIELAVSLTNQAYIASGVGQRLWLVHMYASGENEKKDHPNNSDADPDNDVSDLSYNLRYLRNKAGSTNAIPAAWPVDDYIEDVHQKRAEFHADFVHLVIQVDGCGVAYLQGTPADAAFEKSAFGVTQQGSCLTSNFSFGHELGHNMGLHHDWYVNDSSVPYSYAHGFSNKTDGWRTIMAYNRYCTADSGSGCTRLKYFSNPNNTYGGDPMGVAGGTKADCVAFSVVPDPSTCDADNQSILNSNALTNSQFRPSRITWLGGTTDWNTASNWEIEERQLGLSPVMINRIPRDIDDVVIPSSPTGGSNFPTINGGSHDARHVVIETGATLTMLGGELQVYGSWDEKGTGTFNGTGGTVKFTGRIGQDVEVNANSTFFHVVVGDGLTSQTVNVVSDMDINGDLTMLAGATFMVGDHILEVAGNWDDQSRGFLPGTSTVILDGGSQTVDKITTSTLINEPFDEADGQSCCTSLATKFPLGWVREHSAGSGFLIGDIDSWGGNAGAAVRWNNTADGWLHTSPISMFAALNYSIEYKYRSLLSGTTHDFSVSVGTAQSAAGMILLPGSAVTNAGNSSYLTQQDTFGVNADGTYYLGFRSQQNSGTGYAVIDEIVLTETSNIRFYNLIVKSTVGATINAGLEIENNLTIQTVGVLNLATNAVTVEAAVVNNGILKQTKAAPDATTTEFLHIQNAAADTDKYFGVDITPSTGDMGSTEVAVHGNLPCTGGDTVLRCYEITPTTTQDALTRLYYRTSEANGNTVPDVYHLDHTQPPLKWNLITASLRGGSGEGVWTEAATTEYSHFAASDHPPTFVSIGDVSVEYVSVEAAMQGLVDNKGGRNNLLAVLQSLDPQLAERLIDAETEKLLESLRRLLDPDSDGSVVVFAWDTLTQMGTIGFYAERQTNGGAWYRINQGLLPAIIAAPYGAEYRLFDYKAAGDQPEYTYRLIELEATGRLRSYGPWLLKLRK